VDPRPIKKATLYALGTGLEGLAVGLVLRAVVCDVPDGVWFAAPIGSNPRGTSTSSRSRRLLKTTGQLSSRAPWSGFRGGRSHATLLEFFQRHWAPLSYVVRSQYQYCSECSK